MPADADSLAAADPLRGCPARGRLVADDPRLTFALEEYQALLEAGQRPDRADFLGRFPDLAETLTEAIDGLDFLHGAVGRPANGHPAADALSTPDGRPLTGQLGDFRILRQVGRGGMGIVYEAEQISLG